MATIGRPSLYTDAIGQRICDAIASGESVTAAAEAQGFPAITVWQWLRKHETFKQFYAQARSDKLDLHADQIIELSDIAQGMDAAGVQAAKLRTDNRKWILSKLRADVYGDKLDVTSAGKALATPVHQVDARVQSIIMMAAERMRLATGDELSDAAKSLLD